MDGKGYPFNYNWMSWWRKGTEIVSVPTYQYSPGRNNKKEAIQARSTMACCIWCYSLGCRVETVEDRDWDGLYSRGVRILACTSSKFLAQPKVDDNHGDESGVFGAHCRKYFPHGAELFIHASL